MAEWYTGQGGIILGLVTLLSIAVLAFSIYLSRKSKKTVQDYVLAGSSLGIFVLYFYGAFTIMSAWTFYGLPGWVYAFGHGIMIPWYMFIHLFQVLIVTVLGIKLWGAAKYYGYPTPLSVIADRLESQNSRYIFSAVNLIFVAIYLALQPAAIAIGLNVLVGAPMEVGFVWGAILSALIAFIGGMRSVAYTNVILGAWFLVAFVGTFIIAIMNLPNGLTGAAEYILQNKPWLYSNPDPFGAAKLTGADRMAYALGYILSGFSGALWIHLMYVPMTLRSPVAMKWYPTLQLISFPIIFTIIGVTMGTTIGHVLAPDLPKADQVFQYIATKYGGVWWGSFVYIGAFAAAVSTMGTMIVAAASLWSVDIYSCLKKGKCTDRELIWQTRIFLWILVIVATFFGWLAIVGWKYIGLPAPVPLADFLNFLASPGFALNVVLLISLYWKRATREAVIISFVVGFILLAVGYVYQPFTYMLTGIKGLPALVIALPVELILFFVISYLTKPASDTTIAKFFDQLEKYIYESPDPQVEKI